MIRETSVETYQRIKAEGLLSKLRLQVYEVLFNSPKPISQGEVSRVFGLENKQSISPRFAELERLGVIKSAGIRPCEVTGRKVLVWVTTDSLPVKEEKPKKIKCIHCAGTGKVIESSEIF